MNFLNYIVLSDHRKHGWNQLSTTCKKKNTSRNFTTFDQELCDFNFTKEPLSIPSWQFPGILKHKPNQRLDKVWPKYIESIHIDCSRDKMMKYDGKVMKRVMKRNEILKLPIKMCELISSLKHWKLSFKDRMISSKKQLEKHSRCLLKVWQKKQLIILCIIMLFIFS